MRRFAFLLAFILLLTAGFHDAHARKRKKKDTFLDAIEQKFDAALVPSPKDEDTCFSPDEPCDIKLLKFIDSAQSALDIAIYDINLDQLVHHILMQSKKIPVRVVVDRKQAKGSHSLVPTLLQGGVALRYGHQRGIMHNKFVIVDGKMVEIGSFNYTNHASRANQENQIYLSKPAIVERYKKRFQKIWENADQP